MGSGKLTFTAHLLERLQERGVDWADVEQAVDGGVFKLLAKPNQQLYFGRDVAVILEDGRKVVTVWKLDPDEADGKARARVSRGQYRRWK